MEAAISQPPVYTRAHNFSDFSAANPDDQQPGVWIDDELNAAKLTLDALNANIALLQKDDGSLFNGIVTYDSLNSATKALLGTNVTPKGNWITSTSYAILDMVTHSGLTYLCATAHTSGTFATDLAAFKWLLFAGSASSDMSGLDFSTVVEDTTPDLANDYVFTRDTSASANKKVKPVNLLSGITSFYVATVGGSANAITLTPSTAIAAYAAGQRFRFVVGSDNTSGAVTVAVSGLAAKNIKKVIGKTVVSLAVGDLPAGSLADIEYDGTQFELMNVRTYSQGANVASAATLDLTGTTGDFIHVTGTVTITAVTLEQGQERTVVFDGVLTFANGASLILPGAANITTAAGDSCVLRGEASSVVRCVSYARASGNPVVGSGQGLTLIATSTPGAVATVDFTNIPSTYRELLVVWTGISNATTTRFLQIQPNFGGGFGTDTVLAVAMKATSNVTIGAGATDMLLNDNGAIANTASCSGYLSIKSYAANSPVIFNAVFGDSAATCTQAVLGCSASASAGAVKTLTGLRFKWNNTGNFDAGTINLYGVN